VDIQNVKLIEVSIKDLNQLQEISKRTFVETFAAMNTAENMALHLANHITKDKLSAEILNPYSRFFFAGHDNTPVGYLKINYGAAQTVLPNSRGLEIERIYVGRALKGSGIGRLFIRKAISFAEEMKLDYVWLGVWEHNYPAIGFYEKIGFKTSGQHLFKLGHEDQTDLIMHLDLHAYLSLTNP
jgi:diamine N-acetyltransferase